MTGAPLQIAGLDAIVAAAGAAPVRDIAAWDPPYCGDIGLAIMADGQWSYRESPIRRSEMVKLFASILRRDADGRYYLVTPAEKVDVAVADAPFLAVEMSVLGHGADQSLTFRTNVDDIVACGADHPLRVAKDHDGGLRLYVRVRGDLEARLTRALTFDLAERASFHDGMPGLWSRAAWFELDSPVNAA